MLLLSYYMMDSLKEQFSRIYDQYIEKIYRFVYIKVSSIEVAEDITSKVFLKGWEYYQNERVANPRAFLYRIARNMVVDHYRDKGKAVFVSLDSISTIADHKTDIHKRAILNNQIKEIKSAMMGIKKEYQDVLIWHYLDELPIEEISTILNKPPGTIRVILHRGLKALKNELVSEA
jgi:RNA polymerase sigma-70 factor, ECF subfamily